MRKNTLVKRTLAVALTAALVVPTLALAAEASGLPLALVAFGESASRADRLNAVADATPVLSPVDVAMLGSDVASHLLATVSASSLPLPPDEAVILDRMFEGGTPVLVDMSAADAEERKRVTALFGVAPTAGDVILRRERNSTTVFASSQEEPGTTASLLGALAASVPSTAIVQTSGTEVQTSSDASTGLPSRRFDINVVDEAGEMLSTATVDFTRSRTDATDYKMITIISKSSVTPRGAGIFERTTSPRLSIATLPVKYFAQHVMAMEPGAELTYLDSFPASDPRTDISKSDTKTRGYTIGGSLGGELSPTDQLLNAKLPLNLSLSYENKWTSNLSYTFKDYSLIAKPNVADGVYWDALIAPALKDVLIKSGSGGNVKLTEEKMTPMMRSASLPAMSQWKIRGTYENWAVLRIAAGYRLQETRWESPFRGEPLVTPIERVVGQYFEFDMSDPYLTAEPTVLIRSATGSGACLRDAAGSVGLVPCLTTDRSQMWGLDAHSRYVNRDSGQCLSVQPASRSVVTVGCQGIGSEKQWQWRADRLHSRIDPSRYRLYVEGGMVHYSAAEGRFPDFPVNPYSAPLEPWTGYPAAPRVGTDYIPAPGNPRHEPVPEGYGNFPRVSDDQRWYLQVLRSGL